MDKDHDLHDDPKPSITRHIPWSVWIKEPEGVTAIFTAIAVLFAAWAMYLQYKATQGQVYQDVTEKMFRIHEAFMDHPEMRELFYKMPAENKNGNLLNDATNRVRAELLAEWMLDCFDNVVYQRHIMKSDTYQQWTTYMYEIYTTSSTISNFLASKPGWYNDFEHEMKKMERKASR
jgi:hypothetical protein